MRKNRVVYMHCLWKSNLFHAVTIFNIIKVIFITLWTEGYVVSKTIFGVVPSQPVGACLIS
jgi:hypothetical protein